MIPASTQRLEKCRLEGGLCQAAHLLRGLKDESRAGLQQSWWGRGASCHAAPPLTAKAAGLTGAAVCLGARPGSGPQPTVYTTAHPLALLVGGGPQPGPESVGRHAQVPRELVPTIHTDFHSQKALLFNNIFVAGKFCEFVR